MTTPQRTEATYQRLEYTRTMGRPALARLHGDPDQLRQPVGAADHPQGHPRRLLPGGPLAQGAARTDRLHPYAPTSPTCCARTASPRCPRAAKPAAGLRRQGGEHATTPVSTPRGKAVVVRRNEPVSDVDQAAAAMAGAPKLMLVVNNEDGRRTSATYTRRSVHRPSTLRRGAAQHRRGRKLVQQAQVRRRVVSVDSAAGEPARLRPDARPGTTRSRHPVVQGSPRTSPGSTSPSTARTRTAVAASSASTGPRTTTGPSAA